MENCTADFKKRRKTHKTKKQSGFNVLVNAVPVKPCGQVQQNRDIQSTFGNCTGGGLEERGKEEKTT